jgi:hypothetical protein
MFPVWLLASALSAGAIDGGPGFQPALGRPERTPLRPAAPSPVASVDERAPVEVPPPSERAMAYYCSGNVWWIAWSGLLVAIVLLIGSLYAAYRTADAVLARWGGRFGFTSLADIASLPLLLLLVSTFSLVVTPLQLAFVANPRPGLLFELWREGHPPLGERIDFANQYHPWADGKALAYGDKFRK